MDAIDQVFDPLRDFSKDSIRLVKRCHKPDRKEFTKVAFRTAVGFVVMGFVGFFVKLIFIPINNIIVGSTWLAILSQFCSFREPNEEKDWTSYASRLLLTYFNVD